MVYAEKGDHDNARTYGYRVMFGLGMRRFLRKMLWIWNPEVGSFKSYMKLVVYN